MLEIVTKFILEPILIFSITYLFYKLILNLVSKTKHIKNKNINEKRFLTIISLIKSILKYILIIIDIVIILNLFNIDTTAIVASLGAVSLVVGLALQDIIKDFLSGFFIIGESQYEIGDYIEIDSFKGTVVSVGLRTTRVQAYTGEIKIISNRNITSVINYSKDKSLAIVDIPIAYEEDIEKVEKVLKDLAERLSNEMDNLKSPILLLGVTELGSSSIKYRLVVDTEPVKHYEIERVILKEIKITFDKNNIAIPYDQLVVHNARV